MLGVACRGVTNINFAGRRREFFGEAGLNAASDIIPHLGSRPRGVLVMRDFQRIGKEYLCPHSGSAYQQTLHRNMNRS